MSCILVCQYVRNQVCMCVRLYSLKLYVRLYVYMYVHIRMEVDVYMYAFSLRQVCAVRHAECAYLWNSHVFVKGNV